MITKEQALSSLRPNDQWVWRGHEYDGLEWIDQTQTKPTETEIQNEISRLQLQYESAQYQRDRAAAYPSFADQADMQYWDKVNGTNNWETAIGTIKTKYPKG